MEGKAEEGRKVERILSVKHIKQALSLDSFRHGPSAIRNALSWLPPCFHICVLFWASCFRNGTEVLRSHEVFHPNSRREDPFSYNISLKSLSALSFRPNLLRELFGMFCPCLLAVCLEFYITFLSLLFGIIKCSIKIKRKLFLRSLLI